MHRLPAGISVKKAGRRSLPRLTNTAHEASAAAECITMVSYAFPALGHHPITDIGHLDVVEALRPIWHEKHETARRTLGRIREVFELAKLEHGIAVNPADFDPVIAYGRGRRLRGHFGSLRPERTPEFWAWLETVRCDELTRQLVMLLVLTAKRTGEARFAKWSHIDETPPARRLRLS